MAIVHVGPGQEQAKISNAAIAAGDGGTVIVHQAEYFEQVIIKVPNVTIIANAGDTPVVTGRMEFSDRSNPSSGVLPEGDWVSWVSTGEHGGASFKYAQLVYLLASGITWDGITVTKGVGRGIQIGDMKEDEGNPNEKYIRYINITIKNTEISYHRASGFKAIYADNVKLLDCTFHHNVAFYLGDNTSQGYNHPGVSSFKGSNTALIERCNYYYNGGESIMADSNWDGSTDITVRDTIISDAKEVSFYIHAAHHMLFENCIFYTTEDRDLWFNSSGAEIGFHGVVGVSLEKQSYDETGGGMPFCGVQYVEIRNCLFVNTGGNLRFGSQNVPCESYHRDWLITGCTFVQTKAKYQLLTSGTINFVSNVVFEGNLFYVTDEKYAFDGLWPSGYIFRNNLWNHDPGTRFKQGSNDVIGNPILENPSAVIHQNAINIDNYKIKAGSPAIDQWASPITLDYFKNARTVPSDYGFHDLEATGGGGGDEVPYAAFTLSDDEVEVETEITATNTSVPSSGAVITETSWLLTLPGSVYQLTSLSSVFVFTLDTIGNYVLKLTVTQDNGGVSIVSKGITVSDEDTIEPPIIPPVPPDCNLGVWSSSVRQGSPQFSVIDNVYSIENDPGDQGFYLSYWNTVVVPGQSLTLSADVFVDMGVEDFATMVALFYDSANNLLGSIFSINIYSNLDFEFVELIALVPANAVKLRMDMRAWNGTGILLFKNACILDNAAPPSNPPVAIMSVSSGGNPLLNNDSVPLGATVDFQGSGSINATSYKWTMYKQDVSSYVMWRDSVYHPSANFVMDDIGAFLMILIVTSEDGFKDGELFNFAVLDPEEFLNVWFTVTEINPHGISANSTIVGSSPITAQFEAFYETPGLELIGHAWELLDEQGDVIAEFSSVENLITITFPYTNEDWADETTINYGMKLTSTFEGYISKSFVNYLAVSVTVLPISQVGPSIPDTISPITANVIKADGKHEHEVKVTTMGEINKFPIADNFGIFYSHFFAVGYIDEILKSQYNNYSASMSGGIKFNNPAWLTAPELVFDAISIIMNKLPREDPNILYGLWIDENNKLSVSAGSPD